jgi:hypothetical protein
MSMENELKRIADALERIETKIGAPLKFEEPKGEQPKKRKGTKAIPEVQKEEAPVVAEMVTEDENAMTPQGLMVYCNGELSKIPAADRTPIIKQVVSMFKDEFGVTSVKETPAGRVQDAKDAFDAIINEEV